MSNVIASQEQPHISVMLDDVLRYLKPKDGEVYVDGTFGAGGYSRGILASADCEVYGIDRDPSVQQFADALAKDFPNKITLLRGCYGDMDALLEDAGVEGVHGVVLDIGVSSMQLDQAERGFSFAKDAALDMRMGDAGMTAADYIADIDEEELANVIYRYGDERMSRRIAKAIVMARAEEPITRTVQLANIIRKAIGRQGGKIDPATRTFQALRIAVNDELGELHRGLEAAERILLPEGRLVVVSFHSLEDGIVKEFLKEASGHQEGVSRHMPAPELEDKPVVFRLEKRGAIKPSDKEVKNNVRARSAKLRTAIRTDVPARQGR